jgi:hypothetical protein
MAANSAGLPKAIDDTRYAKLAEELRIALSRTSSGDLAAWGRRSASQLAVVATRRIKNVGGLLVKVGNVTTDEITRAFEAG